MPNSVKTSLLVAFRYLLKPLVRMAVKNGVSFPEFSTALKHAYVDVASRQIKAAGNLVTAEGIYVITSIEATEVDQMLRTEVQPHASDSDAQSLSPLPRVLNAWHTDSRYAGPYGVLRDLEFTRSAGSDGMAFSDLAAAYCPGVSPRALLNELLASGCVKDVGSGFYRAVSRSYVPDPLSDKSIQLFARVVHNLCEAAELNLRRESAGGKGLMQRNVYTQLGFTADDLKAFDRYIRARGQTFIDDIDNWLSPRDKAGDLNVINTGISLFHFIVNDEDEADLSKFFQTGMKE
ncbi:MAG: DUF6502 family protein [Steroidobacteraceae bacterium]